MRQLSFLPKIALSHGGDTRIGKRKIARPFDPKRPVHLTLRSTAARGERSMLRPKHAHAVEQMITRAAKRRQVSVYRFVNVGNHLHLLLGARNKRDFQHFLREIAGRIATRITGAHKGAPTGKFWDLLAWSRVVSWGRDFKTQLSYLAKNIFEAKGLYKKGDQIISLEFAKPPPGAQI